MIALAGCHLAAPGDVSLSDAGSLDAVHPMDATVASDATEARDGAAEDADESRPDAGVDDASILVDARVDGGLLDSGVDAAPVEAGPVDAGPVDAGVDGGALLARPNVDFCASRVIDDSVRGVVDGNRTTTRVAMTELAPNRTAFGAPVTSFAAGCGGTTIGATGSLVAIRHVMTTTAPVRVDIVDDDGDQNARADAWIADRCAVYTLPPLDCASGLDPRGAQQHMHTFTARPIGTEIIVFVSLARAYSGTFQVAITELDAPLAIGEECVLGGDEACAAGASCVPDSRCTENGTLYAACRASGPPCEPGLGCTRRDSTYRDAICVPAVPIGGVCTSLGVCVEGAACSSGRCVAIGGDGLPCRDTEPRCDGGLTCWSDAFGSPPMCRRVLAIDATCARSPGATGEVCPEGASCALEVASHPAGRCRPVGARHALCRSGDPFCDATLACERVCEPLVGLGEFCEYNHAVCADGLHCESSMCQLPGALGLPCREAAPECDPGMVCSQGTCRLAVPLGSWCGGSDDGCAPGGSCTSPGPTCIPTGAARAACRPSAPACDPGLACTYLERCMPIVAEGGACHLGLANDVCTPGTACVRVADAARCTRIGALGGPCRPEGTPCDPSLYCTNLPWLVESRCAL